MSSGLSRKVREFPAKRPISRQNAIGRMTDCRSNGVRLPARSTSPGELPLHDWVFDVLGRASRRTIFGRYARPSIVTKTLSRAESLDPVPKLVAMSTMSGPQSRRIKLSWACKMRDPIHASLLMGNPSTRQPETSMLAVPSCVEEGDQMRMMMLCHCVSSSASD